MGRAAPLAATLIWSDPDPMRLTSATQTRLRSALESGALGVVWIVDEPAARLDARLAGSPLEDAFLFTKWEAPSEQAGRGIPAPAVYSTRTARAHPVTRWAFEPAEGEGDPFEAFGATPCWGGFGNPRAGVATLLTSGSTPLLSVGQVGKGRVGLLCAAQTWRWLRPALLDPKLRAAPRLAERLWRQLVEWTSGAQQQEQGRVQVYLSREQWSLGEALRVRVAVEPRDPREGLSIQYQLVPVASQVWSGPQAQPEAAWRVLVEDAATAQAALPGPAPSYRVLEGVIEACVRSGEWLLRVRALGRKGLLVGEDAAFVLVQGSWLEERDVQPDHEALRAALGSAGERGEASATRFFRPTEQEMGRLATVLASCLKPEVTERIERAPAIGNGLLLALLALALGLDFWLRRGA